MIILISESNNQFRNYKYFFLLIFDHLEQILWVYYWTVLQISKCSMKYFCELSQCISISLFWLENWKFVKENKQGLPRKVDSFFKKNVPMVTEVSCFVFFAKNSTQQNRTKYILKLHLIFFVCLKFHMIIPQICIYPNWKVRKYMINCKNTQVIGN